MRLEKDEKLAKLVEIFLGAGDQRELLEKNRLKIVLDKGRSDYIDYMMNLLISIFKVDPHISDYYEKTIITISDEAAVLAFKIDGLDIK